MTKCRKCGEDLEFPRDLSQMKVGLDECSNCYDPSEWSYY